MPDRQARLRRAVPLVAVGLLTTLLGFVPGPMTASSLDQARPTIGAASAEELERRARRQPNIVFFLTDDMASSHLRHMPRTRRLLVRKGARFTNFFTNISLCCPARASLLTGSYAHNTGIVGNNYPDGFHGFHTGHERRRTVAVALKRDAGYRTALHGKYLNEYPFVDSAPRHGVRPTFVPNGWSDWAVPVRGQFRGTDYDLNLNGRIVHKDRPRDYLGDYLTRRTVRAIEQNRDGRGLALFLSYFGPHVPEPASPIEERNRALQRRISQMRFPRTPDFNERDVRDKPRYIRSRPRLGPRARAAIDRTYRRQVLSVASIDRHVGQVVRALRRTGQLRNTFLVFTSDHGYHMGAHRLGLGKNAPYDTDVRVPFVIRGPGIEPRSVVREVTGNIDVAPTFADMAGIELPFRHDGESVLPLARGRSPEQWRRYFLVRRGIVGGGSAETATTEPARRLERTGSEGMPGYRAVMGDGWRYVRYRTGEEELYDARRDPLQLRNVLARPAAERTAEETQAHEDLRRALRLLDGCVGAEACRVQ